ncbi:MAG TPA: hypothetical protein VFE05_03730 [Longimicrobiaceae bacterium]|jgi:hypothetical protein|nr:hypothetical protein [Longimicrobiaceae bacterium]
MPPPNLRPNSCSAVPTGRQVWIAPQVEVLPRLRDLTLQSGGGIPGGDLAPNDGGGGTVF